MLERALDGGVPCAWVAGDEVYGGDRRLRVWLESRGQAFVMAVAKDEPLWWQGRQYKRADEIAQGLPTQSWRKYSAGAGAKGERLYDWALAPRWRLQMTAQERRFGHYLLVRRSLDEKRELAYYVVYAPRSQATRQVLAKVAGRRWEIECGFEAAKGDCGLDQYEVRRWQGWYRHITLAHVGTCGLGGAACGAKKNTGRLDRIEPARDSALAVRFGLACASVNRAGAGMVAMAARASVARSAVSLPGAGMCSSILSYGCSTRPGLRVSLHGQSSWRAVCTWRRGRGDRTAIGSAVVTWRSEVARRLRALSAVFKLCEYGHSGQGQVASAEGVRSASTSAQGL